MKNSFWNILEETQRYLPNKKNCRKIFRRKKGKESTNETNFHKNTNPDWESYKKEHTKHSKWLLSFLITRKPGTKILVLRFPLKFFQFHSRWPYPRIFWFNSKRSIQKHMSYFFPTMKFSNLCTRVQSETVYSRAIPIRHSVVQSQ